MRSGIKIGRYIVSAMMLGGAFAGLAGMIEIIAIQGRLRGGISNGYGYVGFLVAWLAGQQPWLIVFMAALLGLNSFGGGNHPNFEQLAAFSGHNLDGPFPVLR